MGDFWKKTAELFTPLIDKPKMVEKHLVKPPFKYILDIITATTKKTGFARGASRHAGLYSEEELNGEYYADRDRKILYFTKLIKLLEIMSGSPIEAKPQKIIAGLDPELTNEMLQVVYYCATSGKSSDPYVQRVLTGDEPEPPKPEPKAEAPNKLQRPPSAPRIKKPSETKKVEEEPAPVQTSQAPPVKQAPVTEAKAEYSAKVEYSSKVKEMMKEGEEGGVEEENVARKEINLGKLGGRKKKDGADKVVTSGEITEKELELVQGMIQSICQNTAPLGKSIEFINDDVEAMSKELAFWRKQYIASKAKTANELRLTEEALTPVQDKIAEVEEEIASQRTKINTTRAQVIKNESLIRDLLLSVVTTK